MSLIVGIDLGTAGVTVSRIEKSSVKIILNEASKRISPALVSFYNGQRYLGEPAATLESLNAKNTIREMKRFMGKQWSDPEVQRDIARLANKDRFRELPDDQIGVEVTHEGQTYVLDMRQVLAMQLGGLKRTAEKSMKETQEVVAHMRDVVISVPPYYTDSQRRAVLDSARIAGLNVLRLMNDCAAVALDFGMWKNARKVFDEKTVHYMFMDIGYADTWVCIVGFTKGKATILSCGWDRELGGRDVDAALQEQFASEFQAKTKLDPRKDVKAMHKLRQAAEKAKQVLTPEGMTKAEVSVEYLMNETDFRTLLTIEQLDAAVKPLVDKIKPLIRRALTDAKLKPSDLVGVEMIGGSSRMRQFKKAVAGCLGYDTSKPPNYGVLTTLSAETVSRGCALMCAMLSPQFQITSSLEVQEFVPLPIKVMCAQPAVILNAHVVKEEQAASENELVLFKRTDVTPKTHRDTFCCCSEPFEIVASYEDPIDEAVLPAKVNRTIGRFNISGMPASATTGTIAVTFTHDESGVFGVMSAEYLESDPPKGGKKKEKVKKMKMMTKPDLTVQSFTGSLQEDEIVKMTRFEDELYAKDKALEERVDKRNELEKFINDAKSEIEEKTERKASSFRTKLEKMKNWLDTKEGEKATYQQLSLLLSRFSAHLSALQCSYQRKRCKMKEEGEDTGSETL